MKTKPWYEQLTRRGKIVIVLIVLGIFWWLNNATTPDQCKVPVEEMSQFCIDLLYP
jgi:hypothetical protein